MDIVFLADDFPPMSFGGAGISTYELALGMKRAGHTVSVITTCREARDVSEYVYEGLTVYRIQSNYNSRWRAWRGLYNPTVVSHLKIILKKVQPDVVHINNVHYHLSYYSFVLARRYAKGVVFTARDTMSICFGKLNTKRYLEEFDYHTTWLDHIRFAKKRYNPFFTLCARKCLMYAHTRCAVSESLKEGLETHGVHDVQVLHTGGDIHAWSATENEIKAFKNTYGLTEKKVMLFGGRLSEEKGGGKTLEAFASVYTTIPNAVLLVVGIRDAYAEKMLVQAQTMGFAQNVVVTGWIDRDVMRVAYASADIVVAPSLYLDPFPRIVIEAMASRKPVVCTCYGGAPEIVVHGSTGYVVNPFDTEKYAHYVIELLTNETLRMEFGKAGYERIEKDFNLENKVREYLFVYKILIERKK